MAQGSEKGPAEQRRFLRELALIVGALVILGGVMAVVSESVRRRVQGTVKKPDAFTPAPMPTGSTTPDPEVLACDLCRDCAIQFCHFAQSKESCESAALDVLFHPSGDLLVYCDDRGRPVPECRPRCSACKTDFSLRCL